MAGSAITSLILIGGDWREMMCVDKKYDICRKSQFILFVLCLGNGYYLECNLLKSRKVRVIQFKRFARG